MPDFQQFTTLEVFHHLVRNINDFNTGLNVSHSGNESGENYSSGLSLHTE